jgi:hypothetical protein
MNIQQYPRAGDAVILTGEYGGAKPGSIGVIGGSLSSGGSVITFDASAYRTISHVSCSGGPVVSGLPELHPTGLEHEVTFWRFRDGQPRAHNREFFKVTVPLWEFKGDTACEFWKPEDLTIEKLLADRLKVGHFREKMTFPDCAQQPGVEVFRGVYPLTNIPNRPSFDTMGALILDAYCSRKMLQLFIHEHPVGMGYNFSVQIGFEPVTAFRTEAELHAWMDAYGLSLFADNKPFQELYRLIAPNPSVGSWKPLRTVPAVV